MPFRVFRAVARHLPHPAVVPLAAALCAAAAPAQAYQLRTVAVAGSSSYDYNTSSGVTSSSGNGSGSVSPGSYSATSAASYADPPGTFYGAGVAAASVNLSTGSLGAAASSDGTYGSARAAASLQDTVSFHVQGANASSVTQIVVDLTLEGSIDTFAHMGYLYNFKMSGSGSGAYLGWQTTTYDSPSDDRNYVGWATYGGAGSPNGFDSWELLSDTATLFHFRGVLSFTGANKDYLIETGLDLNCSAGTDCDFSHTAALNFELPAGVSFTSESGVLLTAVPEPQQWALMLAGLAFTGAWARRRQRA